MTQRSKPGVEETEAHHRWPIQRLSSLIVRVVEGPSAGSVFEPKGRTVSVGSAQGNDVVLADRTVSRYHLELARTPDGIAVRDLGSRNGTFVRDVRVESCTVPPGATITVGASRIELRDGELEAAYADQAPSIPGFISSSEVSQRLLHDVKQLAGSNCTVLVNGETGAGKEVVARAIHELSQRSDGPFVVVDCGSVPESLIASELFGHEKGAFTGAEQRRAGAFENAHGGTILLDEIGELPLQLQPTLLGVLERRRFRRVGGTEDVSADFRLISATHRDLRNDVNEGRFREDLYYRLAVGRITVPPLRERLDDLVPLIQYFAREITGSSQESFFSLEVIDGLRMHRWPGNIRELRNFVESSLAIGRINAPLGALREPRTDKNDQIVRYRDARATALNEFERDYLTRLISQARGNVSEAARLARMDRPYLASLLRRHGLR